MSDEATGGLIALPSHPAESRATHMRPPSMWLVQLCVVGMSSVGSAMFALGWSTYASNALLATLCLIIVLHTLSWRRRSPVVKTGLAHKLLVLIVAAMAVSRMVAPHSLEHVLSPFPFAIMALTAMFALWMLPEGEITKVVRAALVGSTLLLVGSAVLGRTAGAVMSIRQVLALHRTSRTRYRFQGLIGLPTSAGYFFAVYAPVALGYVLQVPRRVPRALSLVFPLLAVLSLRLTRARASILGVVVAMGAWALASCRRRPRTAFVLAAVLGPILLVAMGYYSAWPALKQQAALAITRGLSDDVGSAYTVMVTTEGRLESWPEALARWPDWILLGEGVPKYYHNAILSAAVQSGALAGALALALLVCLAVAAWRVFSDYGRRLAPHLAAGAAASVIAGLVVNMFEAVAMTGSRPGTLLWWLAVLVVVRHTRVPRSANARGAHQDRSGLHSGSEGAMPESRRQTAARL